MTSPLQKFASKRKTPHHYRLSLPCESFQTEHTLQYNENCLEREFFSLLFGKLPVDTVGSWGEMFIKQIFGVRKYTCVYSWQCFDTSVRLTKEYTIGINI